MAKIRKAASIESGIMQVLKILSDEEINIAIKKGSSYLRKCSNPDLPQQLDHNDSIKLDLACSIEVPLIEPDTSIMKIISFGILFISLKFSSGGTAISIK